MNDTRDVWDEEPQVFDGRGLKNTYTCNVCHGKIVTEDVDRGVTPAFIACRATRYCLGTMASGFYRTDPATPTQGEWYRPRREALKDMTIAERRHVVDGGLVLRHARGGSDWRVVRPRPQSKRTASLKPKRGNR